ncbi:MAG: branched-chain amino acid ABC transporter permease [Desulfatiglans sp.]|jgi:branched-chain amino acid transport system permease protein|nr:branched-chain amino acid ABC transporter permease [Thermodesulfobacteriota bacterium]MEE4352604.1 branched-chain amino acid ABC transporter permease [Desulfatiglans sp.]
MWRPSGVFNTKYHQNRAVIRTRLQWASFVLLLLAVTFGPYFFAGDYLISIFILTIITIIALQGLNFITGFTGQISVGHSAFMAIGAYSTTILMDRLSFPFLLAFPCAGLSAALIGMVFGLPSLRIKGFYLALATLAAQYIIIWVLEHGGSFTGNIYGLSVPFAGIGGFEFDNDRRFFLMAIFVLLLMSYFAKNLELSKIGRAFIAIRDNDLAAEVMGISIFRQKLLAFFIGSFYAGIAGALWAHYMLQIHPVHFSLMNSIWYLGFLVVGGLGSAMGPIFGGVFYMALVESVSLITPFLGELFPEVSTTIFSSMALILYASVISMFLLFEPRGINRQFGLFKSYYRLWPFKY